MLTIPPDSRTAIDPPATPLVSCTRDAKPTAADRELALIAATQTYLACPASDGTLFPDRQRTWDEFYRAAAPAVGRAAARGRGRGRATMPWVDAQQEIWLRVVERLGSFRVDAGLGSFSGWLGTVARRCLVDHRRLDARRPFPATWGAAPVDLAGPEADPAEACERAEERAQLARWLARLRSETSSLDYRILHLRSIEERSASEVGRLVGLSAGHVRVRHHRILQRLRQLAKASGRPEMEEIFGRSVTPNLVSACL